MVGMRHILDIIMISNNTKKAITKVVADYRKLYPNEYVAVCEQIRLQREATNDLATTEHEGVIQQKLYETPETLFYMLKNKLSDAEYKELQDQNAGGPRWFAQTFKEFAVAKKI